MAPRIERETLSSPYELIFRWDRPGSEQLWTRPTRPIEASLGEDASFEQVWSVVHRLSLLDPWRAQVIHDGFRAVESLPGDAIECGAFHGGVSLMLGLLSRLRGLEKRVHVCDTFEGLPRPDPEHDRFYQEGTMKSPVSALRKHVRTLKLERVCRVHKGLFEDTFRKLPRSTSFSFAHLDCDLFEGTTQALEFLEERMVDGGWIVVDDYYDEAHGVMRAVNRWAQRTGTVVHLGPPGQALLVKGETVKTTRASTQRLQVGTERIHLSFDRLKRFPGFEAHLAERSRVWRERLDRLEAFRALAFPRKSRR